MSHDESWLAGSMMNLLVDYYPEVQFRPYGSGVGRENVLPALRDLDLGYICIYAKGHSGYTTWPSSLRTQHRMLAQDMCRFFRDVTREAGIRLVFYYSGLIDGIAGLRHPEWRMMNPDGSHKLLFQQFENLIGHAICPLSPYWDEWVRVQLDELIGQYEPDGFWVDGDWPGPCYCPRCQDRFRAETGLTEPWSELRKRPDFDALYTPVWRCIEHEWRTRFSDYVKGLRPGCVYSAGNVSPRREWLGPLDWRSGDFFSPGFFNLHDIARMMRWYGTMGVPYDAYVCDTSFTHERTGVRSRTKTLDRMCQEAATVASNGGAVGYWTYPLGNGAFVPSRMKRARRVREFLREREDVFQGTRSARITAILAADPAAPALGEDQIAGAHKALAALHRSPDVFDEAALDDAADYELIAVPEQRVLTDETVAQLTAYVEQGGRLLSSGATIQSPAMQRLLGVSGVRTAEVDDGHVLPGCAEEPAGINRPWDRLILDGAEELYPLYLSWDQFNPEVRKLNNNWPMHGQIDEEHPEPAGFPAAIRRRIGRGEAVHICTDVFGYYRRFGDPHILRWLREIVDTLHPEPPVTVDAPSWVDVSLRCKGNMLLIHLVNQNPGRDISRLHTDDLWVDEIPRIGPVQLTVRCGPDASKVRLIPGDATLDCQRSGKLLTVAVPVLHIHACIAIEGWTR